MKKILSLILCMTMVLSIVCILPVSVSAEEVDVNDVGEILGDYEYKILEDGSAEITDYYGFDVDLTIPDEMDGHSVTSIGWEAFEDCTSLTSVTIPNSVTSIGDWAFYSCTSLTSVTIPNSVTSIGNSAFEGCTSLKEINVSSDNSKYSSKDGVLFNKDKTEIIKYPEGKTDTSYTIPNSVTSIGWEAFEDCTSLTSVTIPNSVTSIGDSAFENCTSLTSVTIPNSVTSIGDSAFENCTSLMSITIPNSVTSIGDGAFDGTAWYENQPDGLVYAGKVAYSYKGEMPENTSITLKDGTLGISRQAFFCKSDDFGYSSNLVSVVIPSSVVVIRTGALYLCKKLKTFNVSDDNTMYSSQDGVLFNKDKTELIQYPIGKTETSYTIPNSVTSIGQDAFYDCSSLLDITIPDSITNIGYHAFHKTAWYNNQPDGLIYAGKVAYEYKGNMPKGTSITLEDGTIGISPCAFVNKYGLNSIVIPNSVTSIGSESFYQCLDLTNVTIPNSVTSIGTWAFYWCQNLKSVTIPRSATNIGDKAFGYNYGGKTEGFTIYGTKGTEAERYANDNEFNFVEVKEHIDKDTKIEVDVAGDITLNVEKPSKQEESKIKELLDKNENLIVAHDITLLKDKTPVQPESIATVKIPTPIGVDGKNCKIYRVNDDNTKTDMNAKYEDGYMVFNTDHFSLYALVSTSSVLLGDADMDGEITIIDATYIQKYLARMIDESEIDLIAADYDQDGFVTVVDATKIQKYLAGIK